jgi:outer membrane lipoprotein-sorting protein
MSIQSIKREIACLALALTLGLYFIDWLATDVTARQSQQSPTQQPPSGQQQGEEKNEKTAEQVYKNIVIFKGVPASRLMQGMERISQFLGVECNHCHVPNEFEKDDKPAKQTARKMFQMVRTINTTLNTNRVTCYTCHRGRLKPESMPPLPANAQPKPEITESTAPPSVDQIIERYLKALGGRAALESVKTRIMKGSLVTQGGSSAPLEVWEKAPNKSFTTFSPPMGTTLMGFDGTTGWTQAPGLPLRDLSGMELEWRRFESDFYKELRIKERYPILRVLGTEKLGDRNTYVIEATPAGREPEILYFDIQDNLLVRQDITVPSPQGKGMIQVFFEDYRSVVGIKLPFTIRRSRPGFTWTYKFDEIRLNGSIDDAKFSKPALPK